MKRLERGQLGVMRVHAAVVGAVLLAGAAFAETLLRKPLGLPAGAVLVPAVLILVYPVLLAPGRRYRAWGYDIDGEELRIAYGIWTRTETLVPLERVQHIDVSQGPVERSFGVCRLILHTAGTMHSRVVLPGLARATAEAMRDDIRLRLRPVPL